MSLDRSVHTISLALAALLLSAPSASAQSRDGSPLEQISLHLCNAATQVIAIPVGLLGPDQPSNCGRA